MVGVAGKSKACNDCKRRRVKCGLERPGCTRCVRARIQCSGYAQQIFFVNKTLADPSVSAPIVLAESRLSKREHVKKNPLQDELDDLIALAKASLASPSLFRQGVFKLLQKLYLPQPHVADKNPGHVDPHTWVKAACDLEGPCVVLDNSLIAFCAIQLFVTKTGTVTHEKAVEIYNTTLGYLSTYLTRKGDMNLDYILASLAVLSTCELFLFPKDDGLQVHVQGIADILRLRKEYPHIPTKIGRRLWSRLRVISVRRFCLVML